MIQAWPGLGPDSGKAELHPQEVLDKNKICKDKKLILLTYRRQREVHRTSLE